MAVPLKILFVCSRNKWRSPTAEKIYRNDPRLSVRSVGVSAAARRMISEDDLDWADLVLVMEKEHVRRIRVRFNSRARFPRIECLDIPDTYAPMDEELIALIRSGTEPHIAG